MSNSKKFFITHLILFIIALLIGLFSTRVYAAGYLGLIPDSSSVISTKILHESISRSLMETPLPIIFDNTREYPTPGDQGEQNSCTAWAIAYAYKTYQDNLDHRWGVSNNSSKFSPAYVYNQINGGRDVGSSISTAMELLVNQGCTTLDDMPYNQKDYLTQPTKEQRARAYPHRSLSYSTIPKNEIQKNAAIVKAAIIEYGGVVIGMPVYPDFDNISTSNPIYDTISGISRGNHAICLIGYDDNKNAFKFINSWGTKWGLNGYGYISYSIVQEKSHGHYVMTDFTEETTIGAVAPNIITTTLPPGYVGMAYSEMLRASGSTPITWTISNGRLPLGLSLNSSTGVISGRPTAAAEGNTYRFLVRATNSKGYDTRELSIVITEPVPPTITTSTLPKGREGVPYSHTLVASGTTPITWSIYSGMLPTGLYLNQNTGEIFGTPTRLGTYTFTVLAVGFGSTTRTLRIVIDPVLVPPTINTSILPPGRVGVYYSQTLSATGTTPITWSIFSGSLPPGLNLNSAAGIISGTPTMAGTFNFSVRATNSAGSDTRTLRIVIDPVFMPPTINISILPPGRVGVYYSQTLSATGTTPITWSIFSGSLPPGLNLNSATGIISGTLTMAGTFNFSVRATNSAGSDTRSLSITVAAVAVVPPTITTLSLIGGKDSQDYRQTLSANGTAPITWSIITGRLPSGLILNTSTGVISGRINDLGIFNFTVRATNSAGSDTKALSISVKLNDLR